MPVTNAAVLQLAAADRLRLEAWLAEFEQAWAPERLAEQVKRLPGAASPLRQPALVELVKIDLERHWQNGHRPTVAEYLSRYPELGTATTAPADLLLAEYEARQQAGEKDALAVVARAFPDRGEELRPLIGTQYETATAGAAPRMARSGPPTLPEQFGRYRIQRLLGSGGMGAVYLAHDTQLDRPVALKVPHFALDDAELAGRFLREARRCGAAASEHLSRLRLRRDRRPALPDDGLRRGPAALHGDGHGRAAATADR